jgi:hypothetical protein
VAVAVCGVGELERQHRLPERGGVPPTAVLEDLAGEWPTDQAGRKSWTTLHW